jgi:hypothetical protein
MPINQQIKEGKLDPKTGANRAFECALRELRLANREDALTDVVAKKVVEVGATITSDPEKIAKAAINRLAYLTYVKLR